MKIQGKRYHAYLSASLNPEIFRISNKLTIQKKKKERKKKAKGRTDKKDAQLSRKLQKEELKSTSNTRRKKRERERERGDHYSRTRGNQKSTTAKGVNRSMPRMDLLPERRGERFPDREQETADREKRRIGIGAKDQLEFRYRITSLF